MRRMTSCTLISFRPDAHEVGQDPVEKRRKIRCQEMNLNLADRTEAMGDGLRPEAKLLIPYDKIYKGERELEYKGDRWEVIDADPYKDWNGVILRIQRKKGNSGDATEPEPVTADSGAALPPQEVG